MLSRTEDSETTHQILQHITYIYDGYDESLYLATRLYKILRKKEAKDDRKTSLGDLNSKNQ